MDIIDIAFWSMVVIVLVFLATTIVITPQQHVRMIETFGKYSTYRQAGLSFKLPFPIQIARSPFSMQTRQFHDKVQVKSSDNVFVTIPAYVQFRVIPGQVRQAYYELANPEDQMRSYIIAEIRGIASAMSFQQLYDDKQHLSEELKKNIETKMHEYGYLIVDVLVDDPQPTDDIVRAFNDVTASHRAKEAAIGYAEAERVKRVAEAEATGHAQKISAQATVEARRILAEGNAEAIKRSVQDTGLGPEYGHDLVRMSITAESVRDAARQGGRVVFVSGEAPSAAHGLFAGVDPEAPRTHLRPAHGKTPCDLDKDGDGVIDL